jgi:thiol-disulfide isomerase/thioredoxin
MDAIEAVGSTNKALRPRSQSAVSPVLLWVLLAAVLLRVVTAVMERKGGDGPGRVQWRNLADAPAAAGRLGKPVLYDFTAEWCAPCKLLDEDWADASVAEKVNASFVPVRVMDRMREQGRNAPEVAELQRRYEVSAFPTLVVAAPDGRLIAKREGYRNTERLVEFLAEAAAGRAGRPPADF